MQPRFLHPTENYFDRTLLVVFTDQFPNQSYAIHYFYPVLNLVNLINVESVQKCSIVMLFALNWESDLCICRRKCDRY